MPAFPCLLNEENLNVLEWFLGLDLLFMGMLSMPMPNFSAGNRRLLK